MRTCRAPAWRAWVGYALVASAVACGGGGGGGGGSSPSGKGDVGTSGGAVALDGGPSVQVPAGALSGTVTLTIERASEAPPPGALSPLYRFGPDGTTFARDVAVSFPAPEGVTEVAVYWTRPGSASEYDVLPATLAGGVVTAQVRHFSAGFVGVPCVEDAGCTPATECHVGKRRCSAGAPACLDTGTSVADGTACTGGSCAAGACNTGLPAVFLQWDLGGWDQACWN